MTQTNIDQRIQQFRASAMKGLFLPGEYIGWELLDARVEALRPATSALDEIRNVSSRRRRSALTAALTENADVFEVARRILGLGIEVSFRDGRQLPRRLPSTHVGIRSAAVLLHELGLWHVLDTDAPVEQLLRIALLTTSPSRRRFEVMRRLEQQTAALIPGFVSEVADESGEDVTLAKPNILTGSAQRVADFAIAVDGQPVAAIAITFEMLRGGRQQRELTLTYPSLQAELDLVPVSLILIADGPGIAQMSPTILNSVFESVAACMTSSQAKDGRLRDAILEAVKKMGRRVAATRPLETIIASTLAARENVDASDLPVDEEEARLALATFRNSHSKQGLILSPAGTSLRWTRAIEVGLCSRLLIDFDPERALNVFATLVGGEVTHFPPDQEGLDCAGALRAAEGQILPEIVAIAATRTSPDQATLRAVARVALRVSTEPKVAALLVPSAQISGIRQLQSALPASVVIVDARTLLELAQSSDAPKDQFLRLLLEQADLTKVSPFVTSSVAPARMFFGREVEQATLLGTVPTSSVAILGSRRIGKTSLLRRVHARLSENGFLAYLADCQTVRTWQDFRNLVELRWSVALPLEFKPHHLSLMVEALRRGSDQKMIILLDEVDQLIDWDRSHTEEEVPEAFFRACRAISQDGLAQFVFSGERTLAEKIWDPHSPHWNFCRELPLRQLTREATGSLVMDPLESLQVAVTEPDTFRMLVWEATSGHPQIAQSLGDALVRRVNERPPAERYRLTPDDVAAVTNSYEYRELYLETYWGQATTFERLVSLLLGDSAATPGQLSAVLQAQDIAVGEMVIARALRILDLYGLAGQAPDGYVLKAPWFNEALKAFGGAEAVFRGLQESME